MNIIIAVGERGFADNVTDFVEQYKLSPADHYQVIHVIKTDAGFFEYLEAHSGFVEDIRREAMRAAKTMVRKTALKLRDCFHTTHIDEQIFEGNPPEAILNAAKSWPADLIIVGCHSRSDLDRLLMGSVAAEIVSHAPCAVLVVRPKATRESKLALSQS